MSEKRKLNLISPEEDDEDRNLDDDLEQMQRMAAKEALLYLYNPAFQILWDMEFPALGNTNPFRIVIDENTCVQMGIPDYCTVIAKPMNLTYVKERVENRSYLTLHDFFSDIELIISNALTYNTDPRNPYHVAALDFRSVVDCLKQNIANDQERKQTDFDKVSKRVKRAVRWKLADEMRAKAVDGDPEAMLRLATSYSTGCHGFIIDEAQAYWWISRASDLNFLPAINRKGLCLVLGEGTEQNVVEGVAFIGIAAGRDFAPSQYHIGTYFYEGRYGFKKNLRLAEYWLYKAIAQEGEWSLSEDASNFAMKMLESIKGGRRENLEECLN